ncbi:hypothetical protein QNA23_20385 [Rhodococcus erythropolis]|uniref:hypothetical protein n=1 Tax=Rhodococcus erythropolis TaxID=1833 RepID=UPI0024B8ADBA|nr:hypothetical protein [Rhodococcus erythropolis]MDJ0405863.1 hypothetical protein [Rhodococcus erythropolis]
MSEIRSQATPARDELAALILAEPNGWRLNRDSLAYRLLAAGWSKPLTVNSAAELDALPVNSVVVDASDTPRTKRYGDSHMGAGWTNAGRSPLSSRELADGRPMRVLFTPGEAG